MCVITIPFRDRGRDPLRAANLTRVLAHWEQVGIPTRQVDDGRTGDEQFNRSAAYNRAVADSNADVFVFAESDMLVVPWQVREAVELARAAPGLVVPFTEYYALNPIDSQLVRQHRKEPGDCEFVFRMTGDSIGAINVVSRRTLDLTGGYDECFQGSWWDDKAMKRAFDICAGPTRWVPGRTFHLYHLPAHTGEHLTHADRAASDANAKRWERYEATDTPEEIRALTTEGRR